MPAIDQHHPVLRENNAGVGFEVLSDIGVNAVAELHELWPEILRTCGRAPDTPNNRNPCCRDFDPHEASPDERHSATQRPSLAGIPEGVPPPIAVGLRSANNSHWRWLTRSPRRRSIRHS